MNLSRTAFAAAAAALALLLAGCTYDYLSRSDKIAFNAGDAVQANLEAQTTDPAGDTNTSGLGKDGNQTSTAPE